MSDTIRHHINRGAGIQFAGNIFRLAEFLLTLLAARLFGAQVWGQYIFLTALVIPMVRLSNIGLDKGLVWFIAKYHMEKIPPRFFKLLRLWSMGFSVIAVLGYGIYYFLSGGLNRSETALIQPVSTIVIAFSVPFLVLTNLNLGISIGRKKIEHDVFIRSILYPACYLGIPCVLAVAVPALKVLAFSFLLGNVLGYLCSRFLADRAINIQKFMERTGGSTRPFINILFHYSWPIGIREILLSVMQRVDIWCLALYLDSKTIGIYGLALAVANSLKTIRMAFDPVILPIVSELKRGKDSAKIKYAYLYAANLITFIQFPILGFLLFFASDVLSLSGPEYTEGTRALLIFAIVFLFNGFLGISSMIVMGLGKSKWALFNDIISLSLSLGLNLVLIPIYGLTGAAMASGLAVVVVNLLWYFEAAYLIKTFPINTRIVLQYVLGFISLGAGYILWHFFGSSEILSKSIWFALFIALYSALLFWQFKEVINRFLKKG